MNECAVMSDSYIHIGLLGNYSKKWHFCKKLSTYMIIYMTSLGAVSLLRSGHTSKDGPHNTRLEGAKVHLIVEMAAYHSIAHSISL